MHPSFHFNTADYLIIATVVISATVGLLRGLLREVIALMTWIVAAFVAWHFAGVLEPHLGGLLAQDAVRPWVARLILFIAVLLLGQAIGAIIGLLRAPVTVHRHRSLPRAAVRPAARGADRRSGRDRVSDRCAWTRRAGGTSRCYCHSGRTRRRCCGRWVAIGSSIARFPRQISWRRRTLAGGRACAE